MLILFSYTLSACQNHVITTNSTKATNPPKENTFTPKTDIKSPQLTINVEEDTIKEVLIPAITKDKFTEGVWIKKYPGNYNCFEFLKKNGYQIICDPYNIDDDCNPDLVMESHQHGDHTDTTIFKKPYELIKEPGNYSYDHISIRGFSGKHNSGDEEGTNNIYVFNIDGITMAEFGSQGEVPKNEMLKQIGPVDVLFIQIFSNTGYGKLEVKDIDSIVKYLKPKIIIPEHGREGIEQQLAIHMKLDEVYKTSGTLNVTRTMLDSIKEVRIISLDND